MMAELQFASKPDLQPDMGPRLDIDPPYLLFTGDVTEPAYAKTAYGLRDWARDKCLGQCGLGADALNLGLRAMEPRRAAEAGARSLVIAVANSGGVIPEPWLQKIVEAAEAGLDIVSGMHVRLSSFPALVAAAERGGARLVDVRTPPASIPIGTGRKRSGKRLLTVGTDCALGKKYTALAIARALAQKGIASDFRATGQTGIMIAGSGIPIDAVVSDFVAGAAEILSPDADAAHWDIIEGQGSLFHPGFAAVSLGLLHGSQPDVFVVCHDPRRETILGSPHVGLPSIERVIEMTTSHGSVTNRAIRCAGVSINTSSFTANNAEALLSRESARLGLPVADPMRGGAAFDELVAASLAGSG